MKIHVLTFATGVYHESARLLRAESAQLPIDFFKIYTWIDLPRDFFKNRKFSWQEKGFGYWAWKHHFYYHYILNKADSGDIVFWIDAGCSLQSSPSALQRFDEYLEICKTHSALIFELGHEEGAYSRPDVIDYFSADKNEFQRVGGVFAFKKSMKIMKLWEEIFACNSGFPELYNDFGDVKHRHDQSVFSILTKKNGFDAIPDETFGLKSVDAPIVATRRKRARRFFAFVEWQLCKLYFST